MSESQPKSPFLLSSTERVLQQEVMRFLADGERWLLDPHSSSFCIFISRLHLRRLKFSVLFLSKLPYFYFTSFHFGPIFSCSFVVFLFRLHFSNRLLLKCKYIVYDFLYLTVPEIQCISTYYVFIERTVIHDMAT